MVVEARSGRARDTGAVALRTSGRSLSAALVCVLLAAAALEGGGGAFDDGPPNLTPAIRWLGIVPGASLFRVSRVAVAAAAGPLIVALLAVFTLLLVRAVRGRDARAVGLLLATVASLAAVPAIAYGAVQLLDRWASHDLASVNAGNVPRVFTMILLGLDPHESLFFGPVWVASRWALVCAGSWVALGLVGAAGIAAGRSVRRRLGLPAAYLCVEAVLSVGAGCAALVAWSCMLAWSLSVPAPRIFWDTCPGCAVVTGHGPTAFTAIWWSVLVVIAAAAVRSLWTGQRVVWATRRLATA